MLKLKETATEKHMHEPPLIATHTAVKRNKLMPLPFFVALTFRRTKLDFSVNFLTFGFEVEDFAILRHLAAGFARAQCV